MSVILLIVFISISYLIVRIGAIALELTGMERAKARFQALSAFTGTGFTTREAEAVINHPRRRKIVTYLMILGNAGIVTVIATFVVSLRPAGIFRPSLFPRPRERFRLGTDSLFTGRWQTLGDSRKFFGKPRMSPKPQHHRRRGDTISLILNVNKSLLR